MQAIITKYFGPSNRRGSRIIVTAAAGRKSYTYNPAISAEANHTTAAAAFAQDLGWSGRWYVGDLPANRGNVYVSVPLGTIDGAAFIIKTA